MRISLFATGTLAILLTVPGMAFGGEVDEDYEFRITDLDSCTGTRATVTIFFDNDGDDINAWQFGICHDPEQLSIEAGDVEDGEVTATVNGGSPPFFQVPQFFDYGWAIVVAIDIAAKNAL